MFFNHKNTEPGQPQGSNPFFYYGGNYPGETSEPFYHSGIKNYNLRVSISTHIGKVRGNHEDNFYLEGLYMNGIRCGKIVPENIVHVQPFQIEIIFVVAANFSDVC